jgi:hypothetical protein
VVEHIDLRQPDQDLLRQVEELFVLLLQQLQRVLPRVGLLG